MNINLENMLRHHGIPVEQRQALADDLFGILNDDYDCDTLQDFLCSNGYMRNWEDVNE